MQEYWFFVVADDREIRIAHATCEFMGRYAELMNMLALERFEHDWMRFATFTQKDYDPDLHGELDFDFNELPIMRERFDPEEGLERLDVLRKHLILNESEFVKNEWIRAEDFSSLIADFNTAIDCLKLGLEKGEKWFLDVDVE